MASDRSARHLGTRYRDFAGPHMTLTKKILFISFIILGIYDFGVFVFKGEATTISQVMTNYLHLSPFGTGVIFMLLGHWMWPMPVKPDYTRLKKAWWNFPVENIGDHDAEWDELETAIDELVNGGKNK